MLDRRLVSRSPDVCAAAGAHNETSTIRARAQSPAGNPVIRTPRYRVADFLDDREIA